MEQLLTVPCINGSRNTSTQCEEALLYILLYKPTYLVLWLNAKLRTSLRKWEFSIKPGTFDL